MNRLYLVCLLMVTSGIMNLTPWGGPTARAASDYGYKTTVVQDACATRDLEYGGTTVPAASVHAAMMSALGFAYATVTDTDSYVRQAAPGAAG